LGRKSHRQPFTFQAQKKKERGLENIKMEMKNPNSNPTAERQPGIFFTS
jgi:hypothetical protein